MDDEQLPVHSSMIRLMCKTAGITMFGDFYRDDHNVEEFEKLYEEVKTRGRSWLLSCRDMIPKGRWFETHQRHCNVSLSKTLYPLLQPMEAENISDIAKIC